jgi:hypothetical protein
MISDDDLENMEDHDLLSIVDRYKCFRSFESEFIDSLYERDGFTENQRNALINIIVKFRMIKKIQIYEMKND